MAQRVGVDCKQDAHSLLAAVRSPAPSSNASFVGIVDARESSTRARIESPPLAMLDRVDAAHVETVLEQQVQQQTATAADVENAHSRRVELLLLDKRNDKRRDDGVDQQPSLAILERACIVERRRQRTRRHCRVQLFVEFIFIYRYPPPPSSLLSPT